MASVTMLTASMGSENGSFTIGCTGGSCAPLLSTLVDRTIIGSGIAGSNAVAVGTMVCANSYSSVGIGCLVDTGNGCSSIVIGCGNSCGGDISGATIIGSTICASSKGECDIALGADTYHGGYRSVLIGYRSGCCGGSLCSEWMSLSDGNIALKFNVCVFADYIVSVMPGDSAKSQICN